MRPQIRFLLGILTAVLAAPFAANPLWAQGYSHARIVRLSFIEGNVTMARPDVQGWAEAPVNTPLQEGFKLSTGENSFAEIQFENGGAIRMGQLALLDFTELQLAPDGGKIDRVDLRQGYATFHPLPSRYGDSLEVSTPYGTLAAQGGAEFRVDLDQGVQRVEVFDGEVNVQSNLGAATLQKNSVLLLQPGTSEPTVISQGIVQDDWDKWVQDRENQLAAEAGGPSPESYNDDDSATAYGWSDLQQYGNWTDVPGEGSGWIPTGANAGWAPYTLGQWCWYPGWGYTWIGAEPWAWLPYHYGRWEFIARIGWIWFPGSLGRWFPHQVAWFHGPGWVGWAPVGHRKGIPAACGTHCGGGVVSESAFRRGGWLTSSLMPGINPTAGERISAPQITPTRPLRLPGPPIHLPPAQGRNSQGNPARTPVEAGRPSTIAPTPGSRGGSTPPNSTIVLPPQQGSRISGHPVTTVPEWPPSRTATGVHTPQVPSPGGIRPVPMAGRGQGEHAVGNQGSARPNPAGRSLSPPAHSAPSSIPSGGRPSGGQAGGSHVNTGAPAGGHASSPPAGGGHAGGGSVGGGHH